MQIIIDTNKKTIEVSEELKKAYESQIKMEQMLGIEKKSILESIGCENYKVICKPSNRNNDKTSLADIDNFMASIKSTNKEKYDEYVELKNKPTGKKTKKGKDITTNFLTLKKWFYLNFPEQNPKNDKKKQES